jgi:hypothetical protein
MIIGTQPQSIVEINTEHSIIFSSEGFMKLKLFFFVLLVFVAGSITTLAQPNLLSPANGATGVALQPTLTWTGVGTEYFTLEIDDDNLFGSAFSATNINAISYTMPPAELVNNTTYYWRVKETSPSVTGWSPTFYFTTVPSAVPDPFTLLTPADLTPSFDVNPANFTWNASTEVDLYTVEVSDDNFANVDFSTTSVITSASIAGLGFTTAYKWRVKATNSLGTTTSAEFSFTSSTLPAPSVPTLTSPVADEVVSEFPTLVWTASTPNPPAPTYTLQVTPDPTFYYIPAGLNIAGLGTNSYTFLTELDRGSPYYWRVRATNASGSSAWSTPIKFIVSLSGVVEPPVPVLTFPSDASAIHGWSIDLRWYSNYFGDQLTYDLEWGTDNTFGVTTLVNILVPGTTTLNLAGLTPNTTYYWRVKGIKGADESAFSAAYSFTTPPLVAATVPVPSWPIGATEIYNTTPTLYWYLNSNSVGLTFDLEYNLVDNTFDGDEVSVPGLLVSNYTLPALTAGQVVYWRVLSDNGAQQSLWSATESFSVANTAAVPVTPEISWPQGGTIVYAAATDLNWYVNGNSTDLNYEVQFRTATIADDNVDHTTADNVFLWNVPLNWATTYYWRVRSTDGTTNSLWSAEATFSTFGVAGANVPIQSWPLNGVTVYQTTQQLSWYLNGPSSGYNYDVEVNGAPVSVGLNANNFDYTPLTPGGTYTWRVRSNIGASQSAYSPLYTFYAYTGFAPMAPLLGSPISGVSVGTSSPELSWFVNSPTSSLKYEIQLSENLGFTDPIIISDLSSLTYQMNELALNKTYYWRVRSKDNDGNFSSFSKTEIFTVGSLTDVEGENGSGKIPTTYALEQNYPNPFNPTTTIKYSIPEVSFVNIKIYDMLGREVKSLVSSQQKAGSYEIRWNGENNYGSKVASGTYIYRVTAGAYSKALKLMLLK